MTELSSVTGRIRCGSWKVNDRDFSLRARAFHCSMPVYSPAEHNHHGCFGFCREDFSAAIGSAFAARAETDARRMTVLFAMVNESADRYPPEPAERITTIKLGRPSFRSARKIFSTVPSRGRMTPDEKKVVSSFGRALGV